MHSKVSRHIGIDWLKAFFSVCIVVWHRGVIGRSNIFNKADFSEHIFTFSDLLNFHVLLVAVPIFFLISSFLYISKNRDLKYLKRRIAYLCSLAIFWTVSYKLFFYGYRGLLMLLPKSPMHALQLIMTSGGTLYYFIISLCFIIIITHFANKLSTKINILMLIVSLVSLMIIPLLTIETDVYWLSAYWNPINFLSYPFAAIVSFRLNTQLHGFKKKYQWGIFLLLMFFAVIIAIAEWRYFVNYVFFPGNAYAIPSYTRPSLVIVSMAVLFASFIMKLPFHPIISFMSKYSLALYCLHPFTGVIADKAYIYYFSPIINRFIQLIVTIGLSYILAFVIKKFLKGKRVFAF